MQLLTAEELAAVLRTSPETVRRLSREKKIPHIQLGEAGAYRYDRGLVLAALQPGAESGAAMAQKYYDLAVTHWGAEGPEGDFFKLAHFEGVTAALRDLGMLSVRGCEDWRNKLRAVHRATKGTAR